jgi:hypothetical protein
MPDEFAIDLDGDTILLFGTRYSLSLFRTLGLARIGRRFEIVARDKDGVLTLRDLPLEIDHADR